jgi:hypothetical protein
MPLLHLVLTDCNTITDQGLLYLSTLPLQYLALSGSPGGSELLTDQGLLYLSTMPLQHIYLYGCNLITDRGLKYLSIMPS